MEQSTDSEWAQVRSAPQFGVCNSMFLLDWMVGAEGFETSVPSDNYAVLFVEFNSNTLLHQGIARIL
jgi:hypothetical protein